MSFPRQSLRTPAWGRLGGGPRDRGFTLLELALVLGIIGLTLWLGLLLAGRSRQQQRGEQFIADLQTFSAALQDYHRQQNAWPPSTSRDVPVPRGLEQIFAPTNWDRASPYGGSYGWVEPGPTQPADWAGQGAVGLTAFAPSFPLKITRADLLEIDRRIDDGNLQTGRFRLGFNGWPVYLVGAPP